MNRWPEGRNEGHDESYHNCTIVPDDGKRREE